MTPDKRMQVERELIRAIDKLTGTTTGTSTPEEIHAAAQSMSEQVIREIEVAQQEEQA